MGPTWFATVLVSVAAFGCGMKTMHYISEAEHNSRLVQVQAEAAKIKEAWNNDIVERREERDRAVQSIGDSLGADLDSMRKRADRLQQAARKACEGASGRELAAGDAAFLAGYAARAARQQEELKTCYDDRDRAYSAAEQCLAGRDLLP